MEMELRVIGGPDKGHGSLGVDQPEGAMGQRPERTALRFFEPGDGALCCRQTDQGTP